MSLAGLFPPGRPSVVAGGLFVAVLAAGAVTSAQDTGLPSRCLARRGARNVSLPRLDCLELYPTGDFRHASGLVELRRAPGPFGISVTADGHIRQALTFDIDGLPSADPTGVGAAYVAWVTTPTTASTSIRWSGPVRCR